MNRRSSKKTSTTKPNKENKSTLIDKFKKNSELITIIAGVSALFYPIINYIYEYIYKARSEEFYNVPREYFNISINSRILYIGSILFMLVCLFVPSILKKREIKNGTANRGTFVYSFSLSVIFGIELGILNSYNLIEIMKATNTRNMFFELCNTWIDEHAYFVVIFIIIMGSIALTGMTLSNEISNIKWRCAKKIISIVFGFALMINILLLVYGTLFKIGTSVEDITKYEVVVNQEEEFIVLSKIDEYVLVVPYTVDKDNKYIFYTGTYRLIEKEKCVYSYIDTIVTPTIVNGK